MSLQEKYTKNIVPELKKELKKTNNFDVPKMIKVVLNVGTGSHSKDPKFKEVAIATLNRISGQKPVETLAKKSISNFKVREGMSVGLKVTLRGKRMYDFIDKLINVAFPRMQDFRGITTHCIDKSGNLTFGFKEHIIFPEIKTDEVEKVHGLEVSILTNAASRDDGVALFTLLGFPFSKKIKDA